MSIRSRNSHCSSTERYRYTWICRTIVSRGDWLGNPANFKGAVCCLASEVETYRHVTMTLHKLTAVQNNMADVNDLFFFGDDFDAVLDILEIDEELEEQFTEAVDEVSMRKLCNTLYEPKIWLLTLTSYASHAEELIRQYLIILTKFSLIVLFLRCKITISLCVNFAKRSARVKAV